MIVMIEERVNHACLQNEQFNVRRILRIGSYIPTYSIGKKTFVFFLVCNITLSHAKIYEYLLLAYVPHEYH